MADQPIDYSRIQAMMQAAIADLRSHLTRVDSEMQSITRQIGQQSAEMTSGLLTHTSRLSSLEQQIAALTQQIAAIEAQVGQLSAHIQSIKT